MNIIQVQTSLIIPAHADAIYAVLRDYRGGHRAILPEPYFTDMLVESGGIGAGTKLRVTMNVFGNKSVFRQIVEEPEPGRVIIERDLETGLESRFTLEPLEGQTSTRVTITVHLQIQSGIKGFVEGLVTRMVLRHIFKKELLNLSAYLADARIPSPQKGT